MACYPSFLGGGGLHHFRHAKPAGFSGSSGSSSTRVKRRSPPNHVLATANCETAVHHSADSALHRLGLHQGASELDIKKAYRKLALKFHPDVCKGDSCTSNFMKINDAYEVIMDCFQANAKALTVEPFVGESMMGIYDEDWDDWEEWMGWEGAGTLDYSNHINLAM